MCSAAHRKVHHLPRRQSIPGSVSCDPQSCLTAFAAHSDGTESFSVMWRDAKACRSLLSSTAFRVADHLVIPNIHLCSRIESFRALPVFTLTRDRFDIVAQNSSWPGGECGHKREKRHPLWNHPARYSSLTEWVKRNMLFCDSWSIILPY